MREISTSKIKSALEEAIIRAEYNIDPDIELSVKHHLEKERSPLGRQVLGQLLENYKIAATDNIAICQDTGMCIIYASIGQDVHIFGGSFEKCINEAVASAYTNLRKSVVNDPLYDRRNTKDNTPAVIHTRIVDGEGIELLVLCKGFGSENMSKIKMLPPSAGEEGIIDFVVDAVRSASANPCPPIILGVCIGGDFEQAALYAKLMTAQSMDYHHSDPRYVHLEEILTDRIEKLGIGPAGLGGDTTMLKCNICSLPTHIAGMPCAVSVCCHASRHARIVL